MIVKILPSVTISDLEFRPALDGQQPTLGRVSFTMNRCIEFRRMAVRRAPDGRLCIDFPAVSPAALPDHVRVHVECEVASQIEELVR